MGSEEAIRAVLVGEADPSALSEYGFTITFTASGSAIDEPEGVPVVFASVGDVASGYVAAWASGTESLSRWAQVVLGIPALDISALEDSADGVALLEAVWNAAAERADGLDLATRLAGGQ